MVFMIFKKKWIAVLGLQLILTFVFLWKVFEALNISASFGSNEFSINPVLNESVYVVLGIIAIVIVALQILISKKAPEIRLLQSETADLITTTAKEKIVYARHDPRIAVLTIIEFFFAVIIAVSIAAYLDPEYQIINWTARGFVEPFATMLNILVFIVIVSVFLFLFKYTKDYREVFTRKAPIQQFAKRIRK